MSKSASCFPSLGCLRKNKSSSVSKLRTTARMPTLREFIFSHTNAGTQTSIYDPELHKPCDSTQFGSKAGTPLSYRSTIAVRQKDSFLPLSSFEPSKLEHNPKPDSPNISTVSRRSSGTSRNNTVFLSRGSFDAIFSKFSVLENKYTKDIEIVEEKKIPMTCEEEKKISFVEKDSGNVREEERSTSRSKNPFVLNSSRMPRIIPITPGPRKRSLNSRPIIRPNFKPILPSIMNNDYCTDTTINKMFFQNNEESMPY